MTKKMFIYVFVLALLFFTIGAVLFVSVNGQTSLKTRDVPLEKVRVQAGWLLNGEFANICSAIVNGDYEKEGLNVELVPGGPTGGSFIMATNSVAQNNDITLGIDGDIVGLLRGVTKENPNERLALRAFGAFWNKSPYGFIVRSDANINSIKDLTGRKPDGTKYKIGVTADAVVQYAIAKYAGVDVNDLDLVTVGYDATPFLAGQVDALAAFWTTQAYEVEKAGIDYKFLGSDEIPDFSQPSMVAIATEQTLATKKETLVRWMRATIAGSEFIKAHPEQAGTFIRDNRCGGDSFDVDQETWLIKKSIPLLDQNRIGWIDATQVMDFAASYKNLDQIPNVPSQDQLIDFSVLNEIYKK